MTLVNKILIYLNKKLERCIMVKIIIFIIFISRSNQCSTTGVTKAVVCIILSVG